MELYVVRVFVDDNGNYGSLAGVVPDARGMSPRDQQQLANELGYSETMMPIRLRSTGCIASYIQPRLGHRI